jgi:hypothetical protein
MIMFYVGIFIIAFVLICFAYVSYSYTKKKFAFVWPLHALRTLASLFVTILFIPLLDVFISISDCQNNSNGVLVNRMFPSTTCWNGMHIIQAVIAIMVAIVFAAISLIAGITYFECRGSSHDATAR